MDALDECSEWSQLSEVLEQMTNRISGEINILMTSRKELDIEVAIQHLLTDTVCIQGPQVQGDIRLHISNCLSQDPKLRKWHPSIQKEIENSLVDGARGLYSSFLID